MINLKTSAAIKKESRQQVALAMAFERPLQISLARELNRVANQAANMVKHTHDLDVYSIKSEHKANLQRMIYGSLEACFRTFAKRTLAAFMGFEAKAKKKQTDLDVAMQQYIQEYGAENVSDISDTTLERIKAALAAGQDKGISWNDIADSIVERTGGIIAAARAQIIAQTEMHAASQAGSLAGATASGRADTVKKWNCVHDDRTRDSHSDADQQEVDADDTFDVGDDELSFPGDPDGSPEETINCRCVMTYGTRKAADPDDDEDIDTEDVVGQGAEGDEKGTHGILTHTIRNQ